MGITTRKTIEKSTERDSSQFKLINTAISGDLSSRKKSYKIPKKEGRSSKTTKIISPLKKQKRKERETKKTETYEESIIRIANRQRKTFIIDSDNDDKNKDDGENNSDNNVSKTADEEVKSTSKRPQRSQKVRKLPIRYR